MTKKLELRTLQSAELRSETSERKLRGLAAVFNSLSEDLGGFRESIRPGAFRNSLLRDPDVRALIDHESNLILGRTKAGTLRVWESDRGLEFECSLPDTTVARDLMESVKRGDISQCSFAFRVIQDAWPKADRRELLEVDIDGGDVSAVTFAAYSQTSVAVRSADRFASIGTYGGTMPLVIPDIADRERLKLRLELARRAR